MDIRDEKMGHPMYEVYIGNTVLVAFYFLYTFSTLCTNNHDHDTLWYIIAFVVITAVVGAVHSALGTRFMSIGILLLLIFQAIDGLPKHLAAAMRGR